MINFDAETITLSCLAVINFAAIFKARNRINLIASLTISCLALILFLGISATNYLLFKKLAIALIGFFLIGAALIFNCRDDDEQPSINKKDYLFSVLATLVVITIFFAVFLVTESVPQIIESANNIKQQGDAIETANHVGTASASRLRDSALLEHYSDMIIAIVAISACLLVSSQKKSTS